ncbi:MAG: trimethylamine methyltransferase family protein, partial [Chloroflexi bacterium]|nr:trimethylamine methyltransferase family protein [Chloroflexota bacterium]
TGVNLVSGPGMLDYLLTFSLEKLVLDDELCGQALHFVREFQPLEDLPAVELARELLREQHLLTSEHTLRHWPRALYLPGPTFDRDNRENWLKAGGKSLRQRAREEVERRLAAYRPPETDPRAEAEMRRILRAALRVAGPTTPLPGLPPPPADGTSPRPGTVYSALRRLPPLSPRSFQCYNLLLAARRSS